MGLETAVTSPADKTKLKKWLDEGNGVDLGDGIKQPLGIETEALILDFDKLRTLFLNKLQNINSNNFDNEVFLSTTVYFNWEV